MVSAPAKQGLIPPGKIGAETELMKDLCSFLMEMGCQDCPDRC